MCLENEFELFLPTYADCGFEIKIASRNLEAALKHWKFKFYPVSVQLIFFLSFMKTVINKKEIKCQMCWPQYVPDKFWVGLMSPIRYFSIWDAQMNYNLRKIYTHDISNAFISLTVWDTFFVHLNEAFRISVDIYLEDNGAKNNSKPLFQNTVLWYHFLSHFIHVTLMHLIWLKCTLSRSIHTPYIYVIWMHMVCN